MHRKMFSRIPGLHLLDGEGDVTGQGDATQLALIMEGGVHKPRNSGGL